MSTVLRVYHRIVIDNGSSTRGSGSTDYPMGEVTLAGDFLSGVSGDELPVPAGESRVIVNPDDRVTWEYLELSLVGDGVVDVWVLTDTPVSTTDRHASGTYPRWQSVVLNCYKPLIIDPRVRINPTLATQVGSDGDGLPLAMDDGATVNGYVYKVVVKNRNADDVSVRRVWLN